MKQTLEIVKAVRVNGTTYKSVHQAAKSLADNLVMNLLSDLKDQRVKTIRAGYPEEGTRLYSLIQKKEKSLYKRAFRRYKVIIKRKLKGS